MVGTQNTPLSRRIPINYLLTTLPTQNTPPVNFDVVNASPHDGLSPTITCFSDPLTPSKDQGKKGAPSRTPNLCEERNRLNGVMYRAALLKGPRIQRNLKCVGGPLGGTDSTSQSKVRTPRNTVNALWTRWGTIQLHVNWFIPSLDKAK